LIVTVVIVHCAQTVVTCCV